MMHCLFIKIVVKFYLRFCYVCFEATLQKEHGHLSKFGSAVVTDDGTFQTSANQAWTVMKNLTPSFDVWCLTFDNIESHLSLFPFCSTSGQAHNKAWVLLSLEHIGNSNLAILGLGMGASFWPHSLTHSRNFKPASFPSSLKLFWTLWGNLLCPPLKASFIWVINLFIPSWCVCLWHHQLLHSKQDVGVPSAFVVWPQSNMLINEIGL